MRFFPGISVFILLATATVAAKSMNPPDYDIRFGSPLFQGPSYHGGRSFDYWSLSPLDRATLNLRNSADLFSGNLFFYHPDLVTPGREAALSVSGMGVERTRLLWMGRLWGDARTDRANLNLIPPMMIGSADASVGGEIEPGTGPGSLTLEPVDAASREALTALHHREGFYGFGPVEFTHIRPLSEYARLSVGGYFPSSTGRFPPHSGYRGQTVWGRYHREIPDSGAISIMAMDGLHKVESPYQIFTSNVHRNDLDLNLSLKFAGLPLQSGLFRSETYYGVDSLDGYGREWGMNLRLGSESLYGSMRAASKGGILAGGTSYQDSEIGVFMGGKSESKHFRLEGAAGVSGLLPRRIHPEGFLKATLSKFSILPYIKLNRSAWMHSPEQRHARYGIVRPEEPFEPIWQLYPDLPVRGSVTPATILDQGTAGISIPALHGLVSGMAFLWNETSPAGWKTSGDTAITWSEHPDRSGAGWAAEYRYAGPEWRMGFSAIGFERRNYFRTFAVEPSFRLQWVAGRHKSYYNGAFETDLKMSGRYYAPFHSIAESPDERLGGGAPIDARFTGRIGRFTFHYGLHNIFSSRYSLLPGYSMMHKEEYWGIEWLLIE